ncbi:micronuclear linker histone polyprotein-like [Littorina saxatilis]|uniref:Protein SPEC3 n=1 Tax=Littorina saxatilis TaxID=31220 RepID=A0AAN9GBX5_9CAEN
MPTDHERSKGGTAYPGEHEDSDSTNQAHVQKAPSVESIVASQKGVSSEINADTQKGTPPESIADSQKDSSSDISPNIQKRLSSESNLDFKKRPSLESIPEVTPSENSVAETKQEDHDKLATYSEVDKREAGSHSSAGTEGKRSTLKTESPQTNQSKSTTSEALGSPISSSEAQSKAMPGVSYTGGKHGGEFSNDPLNMHANSIINQNATDGSETKNQTPSTNKNIDNEKIAHKEKSGPQKQAKEEQETSRTAATKTGVFSASNGSASTKVNQKDTDSMETRSDSKSPRRGVSGKQQNTRHSRLDLAKEDQKHAKRTPSASSKSPKAESRIPRSLMQRHHNRGDKAHDTSEDKPQNHTGSKTGSADALTKKENMMENEKPKPPETNTPNQEGPKGIKPGEGNEQKPANDNERSVEHQTEPNVSAEKMTTATNNSPDVTTISSKEKADSVHPVTKSQTGGKPANGLIQNHSHKDFSTLDSTGEEDEQQKKAHAILSRAVMKKANSSKTETQKIKEEQKKEVKKEEEESEEKLKAQALFNKAVLRRLASVEQKPPGQTSSTQPNITDLNSSLNSSAGAKSLNSSSSGPAHHPRPAHKTHSMQSLAVPAPGIGPTPLEVDDRVSLGSRRDSVRQSMDSSGSRKSVDYRLQTSQVVSAGGGEEKPKSVTWHDDSMIRAAIPALPLPLAVVCLILNIVLPGSGTVVSGMSVLCCSQSRISSKGDTKANTVCVNIFVGAAQLGTVTFFLVGWFWSLAWGVKMVILAVEHREELKQQREKELQALALRAFGSPGNMRRLPV